VQAARRAWVWGAACRLPHLTRRGAEIAFDLVEERGRRGGPSLFAYRADTRTFIADRARLITGLETFSPVVQALAARAGVDAYLRSRGHARIPASGRERAELALRALLERTFEDATEFVLTEERFVGAATELEELVVAGRTDVEVIVPVLGLALESEAVPLVEGLSLVRAEALDRVPEEAAWDGETPNALALVRGDDAEVAGDAALRVRDLVTALRLYDVARVAIGPAAWIRTAGGPWQVAATGAGGRAAGTLTLVADQEDELRAFHNLVVRRMPRHGTLAWALSRFEMGCERPAAQRLTDHLLALRALLEPEGPESGLLGERVAALCADEDDRLDLAERVAHAVSVERAIVAGHGAGVGGHAVADELSEHLRAILRDVVCGHLDSDVLRLADELLVAS
jgi:hypothetical protein